MTDHDLTTKLRVGTDKSKRVWAHDLLRQGGEWLGAARSWLQHKTTTKGVRGDQITFGDETALFELSARAVEELAAEVAAAAINKEGNNRQYVEELQRKRLAAEMDVDLLRASLRASEDKVKRLEEALKAANDVISGACDRNANDGWHAQQMKDAAQRLIDAALAAAKVTP